MITIFSIPKAFVGHIGTIQRNAITSWTRLIPRPEVILLGNEVGTAAIAQALNVRHIADVERNVYGTPLLSSVFSTAGKTATYEMLCYVNADIILLSDFASMTSRVTDRCVVVGRRTDMDIADDVDFSHARWEQHLRARVSQTGKLHSQRGIDYFLFARGLWSDLPPFAVGRLVWDNWLIFDARRQGLRVVDASKVVTAVHQNHEYSCALTLPGGGWNWALPETKRNRELAEGHHYDIFDSTHVLLPLGMVSAMGPEYLRQRLRRPPFHPWTPSTKARALRAAIGAGLRAHGLFGRLRRALQASVAR